MNTVNLVGRLTRDPELKTSNNGTDIVRFTVAVDRRFKNKDTGEYEADFPSCTAFGQTAQFVSKYFSKGQRIGLTGRLQTGKYDKDGVTIYTTDVIVDNVEFVESKNSDSGYTAPNVMTAPAENTSLPWENKSPVQELPFDL